MGVLEKEATKERFELPSRLIIGRTEHCDLRLSDSRVSGEHASIYFEDDQWIVRDLASRNGTRVNDVELESRDRRPLPKGTRVAFGSVEQTWVLIDDSPPEDDGIDATVQASLELAKLTLRFRVSPEEENVYLTLTHAQGSLEAPHRAYLYLLLTLARARAKDDAEGLLEQEQGWVHTEELVPGLYPDIETLNVNIFRARRLLSQLGIRNSKDLIERRTGSGHLRLGTSKLEFDSSEPASETSVETP